MRGLTNLGETCYFNAALQCLLYCPNMTNYFLAGVPTTDVCTKRKGASTLATLLAEFACVYWTSTSTQAPLDTTELYAAFCKTSKGFGPNLQHDAHEAILCLLDKVHEGLSRLKPPANQGVCHRPEVQQTAWRDSLKNSCSVVSEVFRGQMEMCIQAKGYTRVTHDHFTCMSVAVNDCASLVQCFQQFMAPEHLGDFKVDDQVIDASISKKFTYLPRILIVHLKRFDKHDKIDKFVDYPSELDLGMYVVPGCDHHYQLFGVCLHRGATDKGHYTACCEVNGRWHLIDDDTVGVMENINDIIQRDAYVLFYKRL